MLSGLGATITQMLLQGAGGRNSYQLTMEMARGGADSRCPRRDCTSSKFSALVACHRCSDVGGVEAHPLYAVHRTQALVTVPILLADIFLRPQHAAAVVRPLCARPAAGSARVRVCVLAPSPPWTNG